MLLQYLLVAAGGAAGAVARFQVSLALKNEVIDQWPMATMTVNVVGAMGIGVMAVLVQRGIIASDLRALLVIGFLGAFTTFSTFSLELLQLIESGAIRAAAGYAMASVIACFLGVALGAWFARALF